MNVRARSVFPPRKKLLKFVRATLASVSRVANMVWEASRLVKWLLSMTTRPVMLPSVSPVTVSRTGSSPTNRFFHSLLRNAPLLVNSTHARASKASTGPDSRMEAKAIWRVHRDNEADRVTAPKKKKVY